MGLIVLSKVLRYKALIIAVLLISTLAFFQSNQSLVDTQISNDKGDNEKIQDATTVAPSIPQTPTLPDTPDLPNNDVSSAKISISIKTTTHTNKTSNNSDSDEEITIEKIEREISNGSISLTFISNGEDQNIKEKFEDEEGKVSIKFKVKSSTNSKNEISIEQEIEREIKTHD